MKTKAQQARELFNTGDHKGALRLAKGFKLGLTKDEQKTLGTGYECMVNPSFYQQLGKDPAQCIEQAKQVFQERLA